MLYNGMAADNFFMGRTAAYVDQTDNHIAELTVGNCCRRIYIGLHIGTLLLLLVALPNAVVMLQAFSLKI